MALLNFYKGDSSRIGLETTPFSEGSFYLTEDDGALYLDYINSVTQEQIRLPITAKEEEVSDIIEKHFLIVNTVKQGNNYLLDGTTFIEIYDKFNGGNINMVCRVDGTDYIPLLSVTPSKIIFSGIYQKTSVSLDFGTDGVGVLSSTYLCASSELDEYSTKSETDKKIADLVNSAPETLDTLGELATAFQENKDVVDALNESISNKQNKNVIIYRDSTTRKASMTAPEIMEKVQAGENVYFTPNLSGGTLYPYLEGSNAGVFFYSNYIDNDRVVGTGILVDAEGNITNESYQLEHLSDTIIHITSEERNKWNDTYSKTEADNLLETKANVENPVFSGTLGLNHNGELGFASASLGFANTASGMYCFSEGMGNQSTGDASHSEGTGNVASGMASHVEGYGTLASETGAHAEGAYTKATGFGSHAEGSNTIASGEGQHVEGKYNIDDPNFIHIVGNGTSNSKRSNAHTLNVNGEAWFAGDVYVGSTSGTNKDDGSKKLATEEFVNTELADLLDAMTLGKF